jgi:hypothetical protein
MSNNKKREPESNESDKLSGAPVDEKTTKKRKPESNESDKLSGAPVPDAPSTKRKRVRISPHARPQTVALTFHLFLFPG